MASLRACGKIRPPMWWQQVLQPHSLDETLALLAQADEHTRIVSGGTDVLVELQRNVKPARTLIDITKLTALKYVRADGDTIELGGVATHNDVLASRTCIDRACRSCKPAPKSARRRFARAARSPATSLPRHPPTTRSRRWCALDATSNSRARAARARMAIEDFFTGFRTTALAPDELVHCDSVSQTRRRTARHLPQARVAQSAGDLGDQTSRSSLEFDGTRVRDARIALGCVAPTIVRASAPKLRSPASTLDARRGARRPRLPLRRSRRSTTCAARANYRARRSPRLRRTRRSIKSPTAPKRTVWPRQPVLLETRETVCDRRSCRSTARCDDDQRPQLRTRVTCSTSRCSMRCARRRT